MTIHRFVQIGLGPLGVKMIKMAADRSSCQLVAAVDNHPDLVGKEVAQVTGTDHAGMLIRPSLEEVVASVRPDIAVITTVSDMQRITPLLLSVVRQGIPVVSTCEELSY
ncbi:MAG: hypothetical protein R3301_17110, partial [Saprospiraceae bacterium]|nr:hypothetical protein [Saprospiraceae bacterium]